MPSCYLHSFKRGERLQSYLKAEREEVWKLLPPGTQQKIKSPQSQQTPESYTKKLLPELPVSGGPPPHCRAAQAPALFSQFPQCSVPCLLTCLLLPSTWGNRPKEMPYSTLGSNILILRCPGTPRVPGSSMKPELSCPFIGTVQAVPSLLQPERVSCVALLLDSTCPPTLFREKSLDLAQITRHGKPW